MRLRELSGVDSDSEVTGFAIDHRKVAPGSVFGAFKGQVFDGEDFIGQAVTRGAVAVVARPEAKVETVPHLADLAPRKLFASLAAKFFAPYPEVAVAVTGVAGPDGGSPAKPVGLTYVAIADAAGGDVRRFVWDADRSGNKRLSAAAALEMVVERLTGPSS